MAIPRKGNTTPAFRYFIFILFLCIFLFVFLLTRLITGVNSEVYNDFNHKPSYRVEVAPPVPMEETALLASLLMAGYRLPHPAMPDSLNKLASTRSMLHHTSYARQEPDSTSRIW